MVRMTKSRLDTLSKPESGEEPDLGPKLGSGNKGEGTIQEPTEVRRGRAAVVRGGGAAAQLRSSFRERPKASRSKQASSLGPQQGLERRRFAVGVTLP